MSIKLSHDTQWPCLPDPTTPPHSIPIATFRVIHQSSYDCQLYAGSPRSAERERNRQGGEKRAQESREEVNAEKAARGGEKGAGSWESCYSSVRSDQSCAVFCLFSFFLYFFSTSSKAEQATMTKRADGRGN